VRARATDSNQASRTIKLLVKIDILMLRHQIEARTGLDAIPMLARQKTGPERTVGDDGDLPRGAKFAKPRAHVAHRRSCGYFCTTLKRSSPCRSCNATAVSSCGRL